MKLFKYLTLVGLLALSYFIYNLSHNKESNYSAEPIVGEISNDSGASITYQKKVKNYSEKSATELDKKLETPVDYHTFLGSLNDQEREKLLALDLLLFNLIGEPTASEFNTLVEQGFPLKDDIEFASAFNNDELSRMLFSSKSSETDMDIPSAININAIRVLNFINTLTEVEKTISYYQPDFKFGPHGNLILNWPGDSIPDQVKEVLSSLVFASAALTSDTGLELLAKAKFESSMLYWNDQKPADSEILFSYFAKASNLSPHLNIDSYVESNFQNEYQSYLLLKAAISNDAARD